MESKTDLDSLAAWAAQIRDGDRRAIARAISAAESREDFGSELLRLLFLGGRRAEVIGATGAPGAGKSTLVEKLARAYRSEGRRVGILAVDPSSPYTGGAILGDRIRMQSLSADPDVFIRSMATRGRLGGLATAAQDAVTVFEAAGCEVILVETVGVGQGEVEIASLADTSLLLVAPGAGDAVQALKAGVMEIADVLVINKADFADAARYEKEMASALALRSDTAAWKPPIVRTVATTGEGIEDLKDKIASFRAYNASHGLEDRRAREKCRLRLLSLVRERLLAKFTESRPGEARLEQAVDRVLRREQDPRSATEELVGSFAH